MTAFILPSFLKKLMHFCNIQVMENSRAAQVGFAELKKTADNRANIGGTIIGAPIVGQ